MPYSYHESTHLSKEDATALNSLSATGELPKDHYWNALRTRHDANPTRFDRGNVVLAALLDRDQLQRQGVLSASAPLLPQGGFFTYAGDKHSLNVTRFDHWHPFLGRLFEITLPSSNPAGQTVGGGPTTGTGTPPGSSTGTGTGTGTPLGPTSPILPPGGGTGTGNPSPNPPLNLNPGTVPEPASALMIGLALVCVLAGAWCGRRFKLQAAPRARRTVAA